MREHNTDNETEVRFTSDIVDEFEIDTPVILIDNPAFVDEDGNIKVADRKVITPDGYLPESTDDETLRAEVACIVKHEISNNISKNVAYLMKYRYTVNETTNELKVIIHGVY